jgi:hypothetical protein
VATDSAFLTVGFSHARYGNRTSSISIGHAATVALSKGKLLKLDDGLWVFGIDRGFVIEGKTHGHKSSDRVASTTKRLTCTVQPYILEE